MASASISPFLALNRSQPKVVAPHFPLALQSRTQVSASVAGWKCRNRMVLCGAAEEGRSKAIPDSELRAGAPVIIVEAPPMVKTAEPMPMLRRNDGIINPGDVGRILERKPKDVWAIRLVRGAYLIDRKYFRPLVFEEQ